MIKIKKDAIRYKQNGEFVGVNVIADGGSSIGSASVGQAIVVKEVDANGRPTAWEAVDLPVYEEFVFTLEDGSTVTKYVAVKKEGTA